ncbi:MAG: endonuclease III [Desulfobacterales bacterium]|nr:endonuclease III [Desulfobacterales bacterium]MBS3756242.1 endonuclease III [Desulfobacterales bacterium]
MTKPKDRIREIRRILKARYPDVKTQLRHDNPFQLLVATILSAQCTDRQVNAVTGPLFQKLKTPADFAAVDLQTLEALIRPTGFYRNKARHLQNCARAIQERFGGNVPETIEDLVSLPGVGRKTANVVLGAAFGIPGIVVDTHVARISRRLDLTTSEDPEKIETDLMQIIPEAEWNDFSLHLVFFGRQVCKARKPNCGNCFIAHLCYSEDKRTTGNSP